MTASQWRIIGTALIALNRLARLSRSTRCGNARTRTQHIRTCILLSYILIIHSTLSLPCTWLTKCSSLYFDGSGKFDRKIDPFYQCTTSDTYISCYWHDSQAVLQPGLPYDVPTVTVSLTKVDPLRIESVRKNGNWTLDGEGGMP